MTKFSRVCAIAAAALLAGCSYGFNGGELGETGYVQVAPAATSLPEPTISDIIGQPRSYVVGPNDILVVDVFGIEELTAREVLVDNSGRMALPLAGSLTAAGLTPDELSAAIVERLRASYVRDPQVSVNVKQAVSQSFTVDGQVRMPGQYPVQGDMTLMRAIASAQGFGQFAEQDNVVVLRTVDGQEYAGVYNLAAIRQGNYEDPRIYPNDIVVVGDSARLRRMEDLLRLLPAIATPVIYILGGRR
jgi:Periplasmic protein involved in polysaccharide export